MTGRASIAGLLGVIAIACGTAGYAAPSNLDSLVKNSPFSAPTAGAPGAPADAPLEFRGVLVDQGEFFFSLRDPAAGLALWVGLNEPGNPFTVRSYDRDKGVAAVEYKGRTLALTLKQAKVIALAPNPPAAGPAPAGAAANAAANTTDDASRMAAVAEEVRRRRAQRAQQASQAPTSTTPPK